MNEVRQALTSLRSPLRISTLPVTSKSLTLAASSGNQSVGNNNAGSTTTWYDVPAPIIIHCRDFRDEEMTGKGQGSVEIEDKREEVKPREAPVGETGDSTLEEKEKEVEEALYQNNVEAALNSLSKVCVEASKVVELGPEYRRDGVQKESETIDRTRHSTTLELTATTHVKTDSEGVPTISFSFLRADEQLTPGTHEESDIGENGNAQTVDEATQDQLYDFPKKSVANDDSVVTRRTSNADDNVHKIRLSIGKEAVDETDQARKDSEAEIARNELYDVPKLAKQSSTNDLSEGGHCTEEKPSPGNFVTIIELPKKKDARDHLKRSSRSLKSLKSLKSGRRSCAGTESEGYDPGIASMSGSYSDPECPNETASCSQRNRHVKFHKRRLGKAWGKMRCWLREETTKIGEVVNRHAKMQAVGALSTDAEDEESSSKICRTKCASYDLTKARTQELGSITRVEEFGLASVSEECNASSVDRLSTKSPDSGKASTHDQKITESSINGCRSLLRAKTASSDDILGNSNKTRILPVSFSMDKLCVDTEHEEDCGGGVSPDIETSKDHAGKSGLIKRRMLGSIRGLMASTHLLQAAHEADEGGQGGFEDVRRYVKQGGDFCKELAAILHERAELEATYAKGLSKLSSKLTKACAKDQGGNSAGGVNEAWRCVGEEMEAAAEAHRVWGIALGEQLAKPLRVGVAEAQGRARKSIENSVDKACKSLQEWRSIAAKSKKQSFSCARDNERLQDLARLQSISQSQQNNNKSSNHHMTEKEASKLETRRRKAEDSSRRADTEFYTVSVRAERARLEYENTVRKGAKQMELLEEERLSALKDLANVYLAHLQALAPRLQQSGERLSTPIRNCNVSQDVEILKNLIRRIDSNDVSNAEQLLPDFYAEHVTLAMNRERRKQALVRVLHLIRQDLERERRGREGLETLHRAFIKTPAFAADESTQNVTDKLHHMRSMLLYLEAARYKVGGTLAEVEGSKRNKHPLAEHILVSRDKQGLQQSVLKIPSWAKNESLEIQEGDNEIAEHLTKDHENETRDWADRTAGDGNSENPPDEDDFSDFDEFSSHSEDNNNQDMDVADVTNKSERTEQCRAIYQYSANLNDELSLNPGDLITVHQKQADGWWIGECRGRTGIFPATYVQLIH